MGKGLTSHSARVQGSSDRLGWIARLFAMAIMASLFLPRAEAAAPSREDVAGLFGVSAGELEVARNGATVPALDVRRAGRLIGFAFSTYDVSGSLGYAGRPLDIHVALAADGKIASARLAHDEEPILVGVSHAALEAFVAGLAGLDVRQPLSAVRAGTGPDHVSGATVTSTVIKDAVLRSARLVAQSRGLLGQPGGASKIDRTGFEPRSWPDLVADGAIASRRVSQGDIAEARSGVPPTDRDALFVDLYAALITPPAIGQNLLGRRAYEALTGRLGASDNAILIAANGAFSFKGTAWRQDGVFDRIRIVQGPKTIRLMREDHELVESLAAEGAPELREIGVFRLEAAKGFDPATPWRLDLIVDGDGHAPAILALDYRLPGKYLETTDVAAADANALTDTSELWQGIWQARRVDVVLLAGLLVALGVILFSHDILTRNVTLYHITRRSFLAATFIFLGLYAGAQLSVVNVVTFIHAVLGGFRWEQFLLEPLIFMLWSFVALALLFWGRGVFCGWLCPFGALQELLNELARKLGVTQFTVPWTLHERLWPIKYTLFLAILGLSFHSMPQAFLVAEVEPFKTAIALQFARAWPYVLYVLVLLTAGLFIERFFCRYLCPLGAALAIPARLRLFEWLKRRPQCGRECKICATRCTVQAIDPVGRIVPNECIYCLECQANYYDPATCIPLKQRAERRKGPAASVARDGGAPNG